MKFPIKFRGKQYLATAGKCDYCKAASVKREFVSLGIGATQDYAAETVDLSRTQVVMDLGWQGPTDSQGAGFQVFDSTTPEACILNFCTTDCLRSFFLECVSNLENLIETTKSKKPTKSGDKKNPLRRGS